MTKVTRLPTSALYVACDPALFPFATTAELEEPLEIVGQGRALDAVQFGVRIRSDGHNLYVLGPPGIGRHSTVQQVLEREAAKQARGSDWCYVNHFTDPQRPRALELPAGSAARLRRSLEQLVQEMQVSLRAAFESDEYRNRLEETDDEFKERQEKAFNELQERAQKHQMGVLHTPHGFAIAPMREGKVISNEEFEHLPDEDKGRMEKVMEQLREQLRSILEQFPRWQRERRERQKELDREMSTAAIAPLIAELKKEYGELEPVLAYLDAVQQDVVEHIEEFRKQEESPVRGPTQKEPEEYPPIGRYQVNVLVDQEENGGAPVVYETNPTYQNLVGRIEHVSEFGTLVTDFTLIRPGALHWANGGYLILDAHKVLMQPYAWEGLKRALFSGEVQIESLGQIFGLISTVSLEPEPIPLDTKVILVGSRLLYYLLHQYDPDFGELFKVAADFEDQVDRSPENIRLFGRFIGTLARRDGLRPFAREAVARVVEHCARLAGDAEKLSAHMRSIADLLRESDYWAGDASAEQVGIEHVRHAIAAQVRRADRVRDLVHEHIRRGTILIDTGGAKVGQVNGLSVLALGEFIFGQPSRITATARLGGGEVIDIEREAKLGGKIHSKGVMILSGFLGARYAPTTQLSLSASLVFEQSYGGVEGDSASVAELCALLSALSGVPIRQSLAVTGSVNQHGQVQAIGGVNEKIEGFFDVCAARGLSGEQGVVIPSVNAKHLMLRQDVVEAADQGRFHIYGVATIDEALAILTGEEAGLPDARGHFPPESINGRVVKRLRELAAIERELGGKGKRRKRKEPKGR